jgi:outer membrane biosynthesis protein TonB
MSTPKTTPAKKEAQQQKKTPEAKPQEKDETKVDEQPQNESTRVENEKKSEKKVGRVITILSKEDSALFSEFSLSRSRDLTRFDGLHFAAIQRQKRRHGRDDSLSAAG